MVFSHRSESISLSKPLSPSVSVLEVPPLADTNTETSEVMAEFGHPPQGKFYAGSLLRHIL